MNQMNSKIVNFPSPIAKSGFERIEGYKCANRAEALIAIWLCGWALLTAAECIRQMSFLAI
jgi:hypothetical protein